MALDHKQLARINEQTGGAKKQPPAPVIDPKIEAIQVNIAQSLMRARRAKSAGIIGA